MVFNVVLALHGVGVLLFLMQLGFLLQSKRLARKFEAGLDEMRKVSASVEQDVKKIRWNAAEGG